MARILLVNPPLPMQARYGSFSSIGNLTPPLGLGYLASAVRQSGHSVSILDAAAEGMDLDSCTAHVIRQAPGFLGITSSTPALSTAAELAARVKASNKEVKVLLGGPHLSALPEETLERYPGFDIGVVGEGETTLVETLEAHEGMKPLDGVKGLVLRSNEGVFRTPKREGIEDLDLLPFPAWDLLPDLARRYAPTLNAYKRWPSTSLVTSRGCPNRCTYCGSFVFGHRFRPHGPRYVVDMMKHLKSEYEIRDIYFHDDTFMMKKDRLQRICSLLKKEKVGMTWACFARVADIRETEQLLLRKMKQTGCWQVSLGIESGSLEILDNLKKNIRPEQIREAVCVIKKAGVDVNGFFILGSPGETEETLLETYRLVRKLALDTVQFSYFTPFPGTEAYRTVGEHGRLRGGWESFTTWHVVYLPNGMTERELLRFSRKAYRGFYLRPVRVLNLILRVRSVRALLQLAKAGRIFLASSFNLKVSTPMRREDG